MIKTQIMQRNKENEFRGYATSKVWKSILHVDHLRKMSKELEIILLLQKGHWIEKRKNRRNFEEIIGLIFCNTSI
jgi:hypothetical protein